MKRNKGIHSIIASYLMIDAFLKIQTSIRKRMKNAKICVDVRQVSEEASHCSGELRVVEFELRVVALELSVVAFVTGNYRS